MSIDNDKAVSKKIGSSYLVKGLIITTFALIAFILIENIIAAI